MPTRVVPEVSPQELLEKLEELENLIIFGGISEPLKERAEKILFTPSTSKTTLVTLSVRNLEKKIAVEIFDGKGNHIATIDTPKIAGAEFIDCVTFPLAANESWEWKTNAGFEAPTGVFSTYWFIGNIGSRGEKGPEGKEGKEGKEGAKGGVLTVAEMEAQRFKKLIPETLEKVKKLIGEILTIEKVKKIIGELLEITRVKLIEGTGVSEENEIKGFNKIICKALEITTGGSAFIRGLLRGETLNFNEAQEGLIENWNVGEKSPKGPKLTFMFATVNFTGATTIKRMKNGEQAPEGAVCFITNNGAFNITFENEEVLKGLGSFKFSTKANIVLEPGHTIGLFINTAIEWQDFSLR